MIRRVLEAHHTAPATTGNLMNTVLVLALCLCLIPLCSWVFGRLGGPFGKLGAYAGAGFAIWAFVAYLMHYGWQVFAV